MAQRSHFPTSRRQDLSTKTQGDVMITMNNPLNITYIHNLQHTGQQIIVSQPPPHQYCLTNLFTPNSTSSLELPASMQSIHPHLFPQKPSLPSKKNIILVPQPPSHSKSHLLQELLPPLKLLLSWTFRLVRTDISNKSSLIRGSEQEDGISDNSSVV